MIVGREISDEYAKINTPTDDEGLRSQDARRRAKSPTLLHSAQGEIFGIYGLTGWGRSETSHRSSVSTARRGAT